MSEGGQVCISETRHMQIYSFNAAISYIWIKEDNLQRLYVNGNADTAGLQSRRGWGDVIVSQYLSKVVLGAIC